jgi:hypothetical protein
MLSGTFAPITVSAAVSKISKNYGGISVDPDYDWKDTDSDESTPPVWGDTSTGKIYGNTTTTSLAARVEGDKIADLVSFAVAFKYYGVDFEGDKDRNNKEITSKQSTTDLGVYANATPIDGLGLSLGYSIQFGAYEKKNDIVGVPPDLTVTGEGSPWHGVDLRVNYTGIDKLGITFNNNASFLAVKGKDVTDGKTVIPGIGIWTKHHDAVTGANPVPAYDEYYLSGQYGSKFEESWFALYNALGLKYALSDALTADLQVANKLGIASGKAEGKDGPKCTTDIFGVYAGVTYTVAPGATIRGGFDIKSTAYETYTGSNDLGLGDKTFKAGEFQFGIPLALKVEW